MKIRNYLKSKLLLIQTIFFIAFNKCLLFVYADFSTDETAATNAAKDFSGSSGDADAAAEELKKVLTNPGKTGIMDVVQIAGGVIFAFGLGQMFLAFKDDNADSKAKASSTLLAGILILSISTILKKLGAIT